MSLLKTKFSEVEIDDQTARVISWKRIGADHPEASDLLFPAPDARQRQGGIPCILPWFGVGPLGLGGTDERFPKHAPFTDDQWVKSSDPSAPETPNSFAEEVSQLTLERIICWDQDPYCGISDLKQGEPRIKVVFQAELVSENETDQLVVTLKFHNLSDSPQNFETALHTYLAVENPKQTQLEGLDACIYDDATTAGHQALKQHGDLQISGETDRIYYLQGVPVAAGKILDRLDPQLSVPGNLPAKESRQHKLLLKDQQNHPLHSLEFENWNNAIVWFPDDGRKFVCVESASCRASGITLRAGESHSTRLTMNWG